MDIGRRMILSLILGAYAMETNASGPEQDQFEVGPCGKKPNCVSSEGPETHQVSGWILKGEFSEIKEILKRQANLVLVDRDDFLHVVFYSRVFQFSDDVLIKKVGEKIAIRSSSRLGYSDFGVNRKRIEKLGIELENLKLIEIEKR